MFSKAKALLVYVPNTTLAQTKHLAETSPWPRGRSLTFIFMSITIRKIGGSELTFLNLKTRHCRYNPRKNWAGACSGIPRRAFVDLVQEIINLSKFGEV